MKNTIITLEHLTTLLGIYETAMLVPDNEIRQYLWDKSIGHGLCNALDAIFGINPDSKDDFYSYAPKHSISPSMDYWFEPPLWSYGRYTIQVMRNRCIKPRIEVLHRMINDMQDVIDVNLTHLDAI